MIQYAMKAGVSLACAGLRTSEENWAERITRKKALQLAREESDRRKFDGAFAYYAPETIAPLSVEDIVNNSHYQLIGRIWERIK